VTTQAATLESKGLISDVLLESRPQNSFVSDVFVQPSTRKKQVTLDVELTGVAKAAAGETHGAHGAQRQG
jgi:beta-galactosidase